MDQRDGFGRKLEEVTESSSVADHLPGPLAATKIPSELRDVPVEILGCHPRGLGPHGRNQLCRRHRLAGTRGELGEQLEFLGRKLNALTVYDRSTAAQLDYQRDGPRRLGCSVHGP